MVFHTRTSTGVYYPAQWSSCWCYVCVNSPNDTSLSLCRKDIKLLRDLFNSNTIYISKGHKAKLFALYICLFVFLSRTEVCLHATNKTYRLKYNAAFKMLDFNYLDNIKKSRKENRQKLTQLSSRSHPRHLVGKRTAQKDTIIDITSDSQVNSNFPYRWPPASLTFNNYFYLFLYLYITWITINNNAPHLK